METSESPPTQTTLTSFVQPSCICLSPSTTSSSSPPPSLLPSLSRKRSRSPSPPPPVAVSPPAPSVVALTAAAPALPVTDEIIQEVIPLLVTRLARHDGVTNEVLDEMDEIPLEGIESVKDDVESLRAKLASTDQETVTLSVRVETLEKRDEDYQEIDRLKITKLRSQNNATTRQGMNSVEILQIVAQQRVTNAIEGLSFLQQLRDRLVANQKTAVTCYKCGKQRHYKDECSKLKNQNYGNQKGNEGKAREDPNFVVDNGNA
uniref:CCHC-type domain-containing protein n=1 Tax=Tanacetum cinerariifolium TaxID=118510 RepID=A0A6L2KE30_TANCI|nr:hypothetical protein [Tanacetum cinerariifolium]